jgi:prolyl-tRNA synthetase
MFARWIKSWRDLPLKINQWANVIRWEMRTRPFLRTSEFFWQEGHTAHETLDEALAEVDLMLNEYVDLAENYLAIPVISGVKSEREKFPGADKTCTFEGIMPDGKALQMGTSHLISQSFAQSFEMKFQNRQGQLEYPYLTSWAVTTRLIGAVVMTHGDEKGLVLPPRIAPIQVVIIPILKKDADNAALKATASMIEERLKKQGIRVYVDSDDQSSPGSKFYQWELKGVPLRIEIGPKDLEKNQFIMVNRLTSSKTSISLDHFEQNVLIGLDELQASLFKRAKDRRDSMIHDVEKLVEFGPKLEEGSFVARTGWCQNPACESLLKKYSSSIRCLLPTITHKACFNCDSPSKCDVIIARSY